MFLDEFFFFAIWMKVYLTVAVSVRRAEDPRHVMRGSGEVVSIPASGPGWVGFEERCSHKCCRSLGKQGRHLAHDPPASSCCGRVLLQRRLALPLPLTLRSCRCGRPLDAFGHHRAACSKSGVLGRRGFALESAAARACREAGARVATNLFVRDMDLGVPNGGDSSSRWLRTVYHCLVVCSWQLTPHWCARRRRTHQGCG